jgi:hypothetical protein
MIVSLSVQSNNDLTPQECQRALESIIFLVEKRNGKVKGCMCANGSTQRGYINVIISTGAHHG